MSLLKRELNQISEGQLRTLAQAIGVELERRKAAPGAAPAAAAVAGATDRVLREGDTISIAAPSVEVTEAPKSGKGK